MTEEQRTAAVPIVLVVDTSELSTMEEAATLSFPGELSSSRLSSLSSMATSFIDW